MPTPRRYAAASRLTDGHRAFTRSGVLRTIRWLIGVLACAGCGVSWALPGFPDSVHLPADVQLYDERSLIAEDYAEVDFPLGDARTVTQRGRHIRSYLRWEDATYKRVAETWPAWLASLKSAGWELLGGDGDSDNGRRYTFKRSAEGKDQWLLVGVGDYSNPELDLIEVAGAASALQLPAPAATPERLGDGQDFPYLAKPAGAVLTGTGQRNDPLDVTVQGLDREAQLVGSGYVIKTYTPPAKLSRLEFETLYRDALGKAGWVVKPLPEGARPGEGRVVAQYRANGRNLWVEATRGADNGSTGIAFKVADLGAEDWSATLRIHCRLSLYGLNFDFNQASLRADSAPVLDKLLALLDGDRTLVIEVQGHTDNVGGDAYNQRLSEARAKAVVDWLVAHGVAASRLSAKGYGLRSPVGPNDTEAGRARNRRVDVVRSGCTP